MKTRDRLTTAAALAALDMDLGKRSVKNTDDRTDVILYGNVCLSISWKKSTVTLDGSSQCSHLSSRTINPILEHLTGRKVSNKKGRWYIHNPENGNSDDFTGVRIEIAITDTLSRIKPGRIPDQH